MILQPEAVFLKPCVNNLYKTGSCILEVTSNDDVLGQDVLLALVPPSCSRGSADVADRELCSNYGDLGSIPWACAITRDKPTKQNQGK